MGILDLIFPKYCVNCKKIGDYLCTDCFALLSFDTKNICTVCSKPSFNGLTHPGCWGRLSLEGTFTGVVFNQVTKKLIYQFKYKPYLKDLSSFMADLLYESLIQVEEFDRLFRKGPILVPIPLSSKKFKKRGYNQSAILAKKLSEKLGIRMLECLDRIRDTRTQVGLSKEERRKNIAGLFRLKEEYISIIKNKNIVLVDDVLTTGSTLSEAGKTLKKSGAGMVWGIAFAREQ